MLGGARSWPLLAFLGLTVRLSYAGQLPSSDSATAGNPGFFLFKCSNLLWTPGDPQTRELHMQVFTFLEKGSGQFSDSNLLSPRTEMVQL